MQVSGYFDKFADTGFAAEAGSAFGGFLAAELVASYFSDQTIAGMQVPPEAGGVALIVAGEAQPVLKGRKRRAMQVGAGVNIIDNLAERVGVRQAVQDAVEA